METLEKSIEEIFQDDYIVPLYQRNFAWGEPEISQLLQDIYENFKYSNEGHYFIGSLVVIKREDAKYEVIDGQQRLTAISIIAKILNLDFAKKPRLFYDSRPEVEKFFSQFYRNEEIQDKEGISQFMAAIDCVKNTHLNVENNSILAIETILNMPIQTKGAFKKYFQKRVCIIRVEVPQDTDVASYFEIMNNRGEQLQKHEILKAKLLNKIKNGNAEYHKELQVVFAKIWDACSQMDIHIQKSFLPKDRKALFGNDFSKFTFDIETLLENVIPEKEDISNIDSIIESHKIQSGKDIDIENNIEDGTQDTSIIDFPNFLMHVFKLYYSEAKYDIPLNEKDLLQVYEKIKDKIEPIDFIRRLLHTRLVFDKYIIKSSDDNNAEDKYRWTLFKPYMYEAQGALKYKNTFDEQERVIKALSLLQVSFRTRKYKTWLQKILEIFKEDRYEISLKEYQRSIDKIILDYFNQSKILEDINKEHYSKGTDTPHFLFNFIDYLYWIEATKSENDKAKFNFDFKYRNSVEHHFPQSYMDMYKIDRVILDSLGNLCLVNKSLNSKMNNESPLGKASSTTGKFYKQTLPPKQKVMYDITNKEHKWLEKEIKEHYNDVVKLLQERNDILDF